MLDLYVSGVQKHNSKWMPQEWILHHPLTREELTNIKSWISSQTNQAAEFESCIFTLKHQKAPRKKSFCSKYKFNGRMMLNYRIWRMFLENDCLLSEPVLCCIISFLPPLGWLDSHVLGWAWPGWTAMTLLLLNEVRTQQWRSVFVVCSLLALLLSLSNLSSQICQSINDWFLPLGLDSSFTCSLPHSCSVSSTQTHIHEHTALHKII